MDEPTNTTSQTFPEYISDLLLTDLSHTNNTRTVNHKISPDSSSDSSQSSSPGHTLTKSLHKSLSISSDAARDYMEKNSHECNKNSPKLVLSVQPPNQTLKLVPAPITEQSSNKSNKSNKPIFRTQESHPRTNNSPEYSDTMDEALDPYDTVNGGEKFCGGYNEWGYVVHHVERSILVDLKSYPFPDDIKNQADVIYNKMRYQVRRGKIRFQMLFFCTYNAHIELGRDVNPIQLGTIFGLTQGEVQRCDSLFSPLQTGYRPPSVNTSPLGYLPDYCQHMNLSQESIDDIMRTSAAILRKDITLFQENPQTVAAGLLRYFTITNGIFSDDPQKITRVTNRSTVTIDGMFRRIATIDNS